MADTTLEASGLPTGWTVYTQIRNEADQIWNGSAYVAYSVGDWSSYATATPETGGTGTYVCQFPLASPADYYTWTHYRRIGGSPSSTDPVVSFQDDAAYWNGSTFGEAPSGEGQAVAAADEILAQAIGTDKSYDLTLRDSSGAVITSYAGTESLACKIWSGQDQAVLANPAVTWITAAEGTVRITVTDSDLEDFAVGLYRMQATLVDGATTTLIFDGSINVTSSPGVTTASLTYCTFEDMKLYAPQVQNLQDTRTDLAGFLANRARARTWTNERCLDGYRPNYGRARRYVSADGTAAGPHLRWVTTGPDDATTPTITDLRAALALGGLRVTDLIREANAHMAAAIVYLNQPGNNNPYHQNGAYHASKAAALLKDSVIEIDLDDPLDDTYDVRIGQDVTWLS